MAAVREVLAEIGAADVPELVVVNKADAAPEEAKVLAHAIEGCGADLGPHRRRHRRAPAGASAIACAARTASCELVVPWARGDVLAAIHREGEVVGQSDGEESATLQVVLDDVGRARFAEFVARRDLPAAALSLRPAGRPGQAGRGARRRHGRLLHRDALRPAAARRDRGAGVLGHRAGLPRLGRAVPQLREAAAALADAPLRPRRRAAGVGRRLRRHQGVGCLGAARAPPARPRSATRCCTRRCPTRPTPWERSWPVAAPSPVPPPPGHLGGLDLERDRSRRRAARPGAVVELAVEPDGRAGRPRRGGGVGAGARRAGLLRRVLRRVHLGRPAALGPRNTGRDGVVAVHSLSKRSNLAGLRVGFYAGDAELVEFLRAVRQHAGLMVPGPAQAAGVAALSDDDHVEAQRHRYRERLAYLAVVSSTRTGPRWRCPRAASTCGSPSRPGAGPMRGRWRRRWPTTAGSWSARAISTARAAPATCEWRWCSRWTGWSWWGSASLG